MSAIAVVEPTEVSNLAPQRFAARSSRQPVLTTEFTTVVEDRLLQATSGRLQAYGRLANDVLDGEMAAVPPT